MARHRARSRKTKAAAATPPADLRTVTLPPGEWLRYAGAVLKAADLLTSRERELKTWAYRAAATITEAVRHPDKVEGCRQTADGDLQLSRSVDVWAKLQSLTVRTAGVVGSAIAMQLSQQEQQEATG